MGGVGDAADWVLDLVHQGLLPLSRHTLLTARLVCKHWRRRLSADITHLTLPYDAWATFSSSSSSRPAASSAAVDPTLDQTGWRSAATAAAAAMAAVAAMTGGLDEAGEAAEAAPRAKRARETGSARNKARAAAAGTGAAPAAAAAAAAGDIADHKPESLLPNSRGEPPAGDKTLAAAVAAPVTDLAMLEVTHSPLPAMAAVQQQQQHGEAPAAPDTNQQQQQQQQQQVCPLHQLPDAYPACTHATLSNKRSPWNDPQAGCGAAAVAAAVAALAQLPRLNSLCIQGYMPAADWQPVLAALATGGAGAAPLEQQQQQGQRSKQQQQQELGKQRQELGKQWQELEQQHEGQQKEQELLGMQRQQQASAIEQQQQQQQEPPQQHQQQPPQQQQPAVLSLCSQLVSLDLRSLELPPPLLLESVLVSLRGLRCLELHASMESVLEAAHLEALSSGTQLTFLRLTVYQAAHSRCPLDPLMALTNLRHLHVAYGGIFNDQRPALSDSSAVSRLVHLTSLGSSGLAQPLLPQPNLSELCSFHVSGLTKRLAESAVLLISSCSSSRLRELRLEAGRRHIAAVAADQLVLLSSMTHVTHLRLALSKGGLAAGKSAQQLTQLAGLASLKTLWLGSGDHRLGLSTEVLQDIGAQWPLLDTLSLSGFSPLQGFAGLGAFSGLTALSLKPGVGTGKLLLELDVALQQLSRLKRLHLDFKTALTLEHLENVAAACGSRLQHLSLNMWAPGIGSKALVAIGQLSQLTSLQLLNMRAVVLSGPPGILALQGMTGLQLLCVQAAGEVITDQQPLELGRYLSEVLAGHTESHLRELRVWLGSGVEARMAEGGVARVVAQQLPDCRCIALKEPEKAML